jgi:hypothetical protein
MDEKRKLQISNGYYLVFEQLAQILVVLKEHPDLKRVPRTLFMEQTGLAERQVENLVSIGCACGLIRPVTSTLTGFGSLVAEHDGFANQSATLEFLHFCGAGNRQNLVWFDLFNELLHDLPSATGDEWLARFREKYASIYSQKTITDHFRHELRFLVDAYTKRNLRKLELIVEGSDGRLQARRYASPDPYALAAMLYRFAAEKRSHVWEIAEMAAMPGSPAMVLHLDIGTFRTNLENLHERGWLRLESRHNLDQVRLRDEFTPLCFMEAYYEGREPTPAGPSEGRQGLLLL